MDNRSLGPDLEAVVNKLLENGRFASRTDLLREGVRLISEREKVVAELERRLAQGLAEARSGDAEDAEIVFDRLIAHYENRAKSAA